MQRTRQVFAEMLAFIRESGSPGQQRFSWLIEAFIDEALQEMADGTPEQTAAFFEKMSSLLHWIATGEASETDVTGLPMNLGTKLAIESVLVSDSAS